MFCVFENVCMLTTYIPDNEESHGLELHYRQCNIHAMWVLGTKPKSPFRAASALIH